ncbi:CBF-domain-containing protein [Hesseltinella vesiculosa]|uniref:CBF-domain-containing protein n=1 Tax=Hesseltinella vesiculosa TaxID=101127 RepID=A0A1X2GMG0_9FUNG|nr:CBF-domain-containing protein [Hesseltinella vesiculosa]
MSQKRKRSNDQLDAKEAKHRIRTLEATLNDKSQLNNLVDLLQIAQSTQPKIVHAAIHALHRVFTHYLVQGDLRPLSKSEDKSSNVAKVILWLRDQYHDFQARLRDLLDQDEPGLQLPAMSILLHLIKTESEAHTQRQVSKKQAVTGYFANQYYGLLVSTLLQSPHFIGPLQKEFVEKYVNVYDDLRHYFYKDAAEVIDKALKQATGVKEEKDQDTKQQKKKQRATPAKRPSSTPKLHQLLVNTFAVTEAIVSMPTESAELDDFWTVHPSKPSEDGVDDDTLDDLLGDGLSGNEDDEMDDKAKPSQKTLPPLLQMAVHKRSFTHCWLALLRLPMTEDYYRQCLLVMHKRILPHMTDPRLMMDFLTDAYNVGGAVSLLALNGVFTLMNEHNLDYPDFYHKLYTLLDRNVLHMKYRSRFFRLLDLFLSSTYLSANLIAAFIKRLARLSLTAPPAACVIIIPMIYNLLKRHPTCMKLIHRADATVEQDDPFNFDEPNPYECHAMESSLWELQTLSEHYYANVSTLAKIFTEQFLKPKYNLEDFLDHTYSTFFKTEIERRHKKAPALSFEKPATCVWEL